MKRISLILCILSSTWGQSQELESILIAGPEANKLTQSYVNPALKGLIYSMNDGWYTTGKTHELLGFDITIGVNLALVPDADRTFMFRPGNYRFLTTQSGNDEEVQTLLGSDQETILDVRIPIGDGTYKVSQFEMPGGIGDDLPVNGVPGPSIQVGLGLPTKTDVKFRLVPNIGADDKVNNFLFGLGFQHDVTQYIPTLEETPFSLSALLAYGHTKVTYLIDDESALDDVIVTDGEGVFKLNTWTFQAIGSVDFKIINFHASLGYGSGRSTLQLNGDYNLEYDVEDEQGNNLGTVRETLTNPIDLNTSVGSLRFSVGTRIDLSIFKIYAAYALQEYNTLSAGISISVR